MLNKRDPDAALSALRLARMAVQAETDVDESLRNRLQKEVEAPILFTTRDAESH